MSLAFRALAMLGAALGLWCSFGVVAVPHRADAGFRLAVLPSPLVLGLAFLASLVALWRGRDTLRRWAPLVVSAWFCLLPWLPGHLWPPMLLWTGKLAWAFLALSLLAILASAPVRWSQSARDLCAAPRTAPIVAAASALTVYLYGAVQLQGIVPGGDEPHYLVITQSVLYDGDLQIENNHRRRDYEPYFAGTLRPDYLRRGKDKQIYSVHAPGLPVLILPAFALGGYAGVVVFLASLMAAGTGLAWWLAWRLTGDAAAAWFGWASSALAAPFAIQAFSIYPDAIGSLIALVGVGALIGPVGARAWAWLACGAALGMLPWLHARHAAIAGVLGAAIATRLVLARSWRALACFAVVPVMAAAGWFGFFLAIYGTASPAAPYGGARQMSSTSFLPVSLPGLLFDQQFGLLSNAPALAVAVLGIALLAWRGDRLAFGTRRDRVLLASALAALSIACACAAGTHRMWWAGSSSPARFLVPLVLPLTLSGAAFWRLADTRSSRLLACGALAVTIGMTAIFLNVDGGRLAFNFRDGYSRLADWVAPAADLASGLPSLIRDPLPIARTRIVIWLSAALFVWVVLFAAERWLRQTTGTLATLAFAATAIAAMVALHAGWAAGRSDALRPDASQMALMRAAASGWRTVPVSYAPWPSIASTERLLTGLRLETVARGRLAPGELLALTGVPAGRYRVRWSAAAEAHGIVSVSVGRGPELRARSLATGPRGELDLPLPVDVRAVIVRADEDARGGIASAWIEPVALPFARARVGGVAMTAARYGEVDAFALDDRSFVEPAGIWIGSTGPAELVLQTGGAGAGRIRLVVSGGPIDNACTLAAGSWHERVELAAGVSRAVAVPAPAGTPAVRVVVTADRWFRPTDVDAASGDGRQLGCRLEFR